jgi:energy-converting hydrogenase Eha subunit C
MDDRRALGAPAFRVQPFRAAAAVLGGGTVALTVAFAVAAAMSDDRPIDRFHFAAGSVCSVILGTAMIVLAVRPRENVAAVQFVVVGAIVALVAGSVGDDMTKALYFIPAIAAIVVVLFYPWNADIWRLGESRPVLFAIGIVTALALIAYAATQPHFNMRALPGDPQVRFDHYTGLALAGAFASVATAVAGIGAPGWRIVGWIAAAAFVVFGTLAAAFAGSVDAVSGVWGWAGVAAGGSTLVATEISQRRSTSRR